MPEVFDGQTGLYPKLTADARRHTQTFLKGDFRMLFFVGGGKCNGQRRRAEKAKAFTIMIERDFDIPFIADLALREKQIQQNYRPVIAVHKWFARWPGTLFRGHAGKT